MHATQKLTTLCGKKPRNARKYRKCLMKITAAKPKPLSKLSAKRLTADKQKRRFIEAAREF